MIYLKRLKMSENPVIIYIILMIVKVETVFTNFLLKMLKLINISIKIYELRYWKNTVGNSHI